MDIGRFEGPEDETSIAQCHDLEASFDTTDGSEVMLFTPKVEQAQAFCLNEALDQTIVAVYLIRQKLRALGEDAKDEATVIATIDAPISLLVPGISILKVWQDNRQGCAQIWDALNKLLVTLDRWCPHPAGLSTAPSPPEPATD